MKFVNRIGGCFSLIILSIIDWISLFFLIVLGFESYLYFADYETFKYYYLYFLNYSEINWVGFIFLMASYRRMKFVGKVAITGIFFILIANTVQLHIGFTDRIYFLLYIGFVFMFIFIAYVWEIFRLIEEYFTNSNPK
jgi:hypothetical protein